jgi:hypothetical protein
MVSPFLQTIWSEPVGSFERALVHEERIFRWGTLREEEYLHLQSYKSRGV